MVRPGVDNFFRVFGSLGQTMLKNTFFHQILLLTEQNYLAGWIRSFGWPDLSRGLYFAHPWVRPSGVKKYIKFFFVCLLDKKANLSYFQCLATPEWVTTPSLRITKFNYYKKCILKLFSFLFKLIFLLVMVEF